VATERLTKRSLFDAEVYASVVERIGRLEPTSTSNWGKMNAAQMLSHCAEIQDVMNGTKELKTNFLLKLIQPMIRNMVVNDKPYKKNNPTAPQYERLDDRDFETEKQKLLNSLALFYNMDKTEAANLKHSFFGKMTLDEKGWAMYKHLDHHLEQFSV